MYYRFRSKREIHIPFSDSPRHFPDRTPPYIMYEMQRTYSILSFVLDALYSVVKYNTIRYILYLIAKNSIVWYSIVVCNATPSWPRIPSDVGNSSTLEFVGLFTRVQDENWVVKLAGVNSTCLFFLHVVRICYTVCFRFEQWVWAKRKDHSYEINFSVKVLLFTFKKMSLKILTKITKFHWSWN